MQNFEESTLYTDNKVKDLKMALKPCRECKKKFLSRSNDLPNPMLQKYYQIPDEDSFSAEKRVNAERKKAFDKY